MRDYVFSKKFGKSILKLDEFKRKIVKKKINEILKSENLDRYKNLKYKLKDLKRVHVDTSFVILFYEENSIVYFVDYCHHDDAYDN